MLPAGIGTLGRNSVRTPGEFDPDLAVGRKFPIREGVQLVLRAEAFNILNHTSGYPFDSHKFAFAQHNARGDPQPENGKGSF